jgi:hypothetical protein
VTDFYGSSPTDTTTLDPQPDKSRFAIWQAASTGFGAGNFRVLVGDLITTGDGGATDADNVASATAGASHTVTVTANQFRSYDGMPFVNPARRTSIKGTVFYSVNAQVADGTYYVGLGQVLGAGVDPTTADFIGIGVKKVSGNPIGNWQLFTSQAGVVSSTDTGIPILNQRYKFEIVLDSGLATLKINGALVAKTQSNLPTAVIGHKWFLKDNNIGGGVESAIFEYNYADNVTP